MVDKIEMSLDDIIKADRSQKRTNFQGKRGGGARRGGPQRGPRRGVSAAGAPRKPGGGGGSPGALKGRTRGGGVQKAKFARGDVNSAWKHDMYDGPKRGGVAAAAAAAIAGIGGTGLTKLIVGNLDYGVSNTDIKELFNEFGTLKKASVHYDRSGRSLGTADVIFERRSDALKAIKQYNGVPLDGRPMSIQLATDVSALQRTNTAGGGVPVKRRVGSGPSPNKRTFGGGASGQARRGFKPRGGGAAGGRKPAGGRRVRQEAPTAEELDAELDAYANDMKA